MIFDIIIDRKRPIYLFEQDYAHHLVRKCHRRKRKPDVGFFLDAVGKSRGTSDNKRDA